MEAALTNAILSPVSVPEEVSLESRDKPYRRPMPPRNMLLAEQITHDDLPLCYQDCLRSNDGKSIIHMDKVSYMDRFWILVSLPFSLHSIHKFSPKLADLV